MRVLLANKFYDPRGGTERVLFDLEDGLRDRGHEVAVFACAHPENRATPWSRYFVPERDYTSRALGVRLRHAAGTLYDRQARLHFARLLDDFGPDVVHVHNIYHQLSPSILDEVHARRIPTVMTLHDYKLVCPVYRLFRDGAVCEKCVGTEWPLWSGVHNCSRGSRAESWLLAIESSLHRMRRSYERAVTVFVSPSEFLARLVKRQGIPARRIQVIRNAPRLRPASADASARDRDPTLLVTGRLSEEKGVHVLIAASARVPEVQVRIAGTGPSERRLREQARDLPHVHFLGHLDPDRLVAERARAWAVAVPSVWYENAPLSVLEAYCAGRPVLAADHGGLVEMVVEGVSGWRLGPGDVDAWADAMRRLQGAQSALMLMGARARALADREYGYDHFLDEHEQLYARLLPTHRDLA